MLYIFVLAEEDVPREDDVPEEDVSSKSQQVFDTLLAVANERPAIQPVGRGALSMRLPDYSQTADYSQAVETELPSCMRLLPVVQAAGLHDATAECRAGAGGSGERHRAIARAECGRAHGDRT